MVLASVGGMSVGSGGRSPPAKKLEVLKYNVLGALGMRKVRVLMSGGCS